MRARIDSYWQDRATSSATVQREIDLFATFCQIFRLELLLLLISVMITSLSQGQIPSHAAGCGVAGCNGPANCPTHRAPQLGATHYFNPPSPPAGITPQAPQQPNVSQAAIDKFVAKGWDLYRQGRHDEAIKQFQEALNLGGNRDAERGIYWSHVERGRQLWNDKQYNKAWGYFLTAENWSRADENNTANGLRIRLQNWWQEQENLRKRQADEARRAVEERLRELSAEAETNRSKQLRQLEDIQSSLLQDIAKLRDTNSLKWEANSFPNRLSKEDAAAALASSALRGLTFTDPSVVDLRDIPNRTPDPSKIQESPEHQRLRNEVEGLRSDDLRGVFERNLALHRNMMRRLRPGELEILLNQERVITPKEQEEWRQQEMESTRLREMNSLILARIDRERAATEIQLTEEARQMKLDMARLRSLPEFDAALKSADARIREKEKRALQAAIETHAQRSKVAMSLAAKDLSAILKLPVTDPRVQARVVIAFAGAVLGDPQSAWEKLPAMAYVNKLAEKAAAGLRADQVDAIRRGHSEWKAEVARLVELADKGLPPLAK